jgi:hypothetical protein
MSALAAAVLAFLAGDAPEEGNPLELRAMTQDTRVDEPQEPESQEHTSLVPS